MDFCPESCSYPYKDKGPYPPQWPWTVSWVSVFLGYGRRPSRLSGLLELCAYRACAGGDSLVPGVPGAVFTLYFIPSIGSFLLAEGFFRPLWLEHQKSVLGSLQPLV